MPYSTYTFAQLRQELANALNDGGKVRWVDGELKVHLWNSLRFWNVLTGDNKQWYQLAVTGGATVWYDLQQIIGSPRLCTLLDTDLYSWLQYALIEGQAPLTAALSSGQFSTDQLVQSLQRSRDEFLFRTGCTSTVYSPAVTPNVADLALRETVIEVRRAYWWPAGSPLPAGANPFPLWRSDEFAVGAYARFGVNSPGNPQVYSPGVEPPLLLTMTPPPGFAGALELLTTESQSALSNPPPPGTLLLLPNDFAPALYWRTLADLMDMNAECRDEERAKYARSRYEQFCELISSYPFVLAGRVAGLPVMADAVENLDRYMPDWELSIANPLILGYSGQNLVAFPAPGAQNVSLFVVANANLPVADGDPVQLGREVMDAILGYAQHTASFKDGWAEVQATMPLFKAIVQLAAKRNAKVRAMSTFRDLLYERATREDEQVAREDEGATEEAVT
jgi:hypothetical protein